MNRSGLVLVGAGVLVLGYAIVYNGMSNLATPGTPAFPFGPVSVIGGLIPGAVTRPTKRGASQGAAAGVKSGTAPARRQPPNRWRTRGLVMAGRRGYSAGDRRALDTLVQGESGWNPNAVNPSSGAYGIPQILPSAHPDAKLQHDPLGQLRWLFRYIAARYGNARNALAHKQSTGWY